MAKFYGVIGFGEAVELNPGVYDEAITEYQYIGDVIRNSRRLQEGGKVNDDLAINNSISIVADQFLNEHFFAIRYILWMGTKWKVSEVEVQTPQRLILRLGGVYHGPTPTPATP